ncbi:MAG: hypothetical protein HKN92_04155, partial [Chitinophagales bacterium]|nr:hypothetical protein [Chitinophagales bacterium]
EYRPHYRWQHFLVFLIYPFLSMLILFVGDFLIFRQTKNAGIVDKHPPKEWIILICSKLYYVALVFVIPLIFSPWSFTQILLAFISFHLINGWIIAFVFMPSHYFPQASYYEHSEKKHEWFEHQMSTTMDLSPGNRLISGVLGGLNLNVAHHLFPNFCHTHYFEISRIIREESLAEDVTYFNLPYSKAIKEHWRFLKELGTAE